MLLSDAVGAVRAVRLLLLSDVGPVLSGAVRWCCPGRCQALTHTSHTDDTIKRIPAGLYYTYCLYSPAPTPRRDTIHHCLNSANATHRHNAALAAVHRALTSVTSDTLPVGSIQLADKGDGTPASKAERKRYYAHVNKGHNPGLIRFGSMTTCFKP